MDENIGDFYILYTNIYGDSLRLYNNTENIGTNDFFKTIVLKGDFMYLGGIETEQFLVSKTWAEDAVYKNKIKICKTNLIGSI